MNYRERDSELRSFRSFDDVEQNETLSDRRFGGAERGVRRHVDCSCDSIASSSRGNCPAGNTANDLVPEPDIEAIRATQDEMLAAKRSIQELVVDHLLAEKEVLTPGQQQQLFAMLRNRTGCAADPTTAGRPRGGLGPILQNPDGS
jgi:hypothetical protein